MTTASTDQPAPAASGPPPDPNRLSDYPTIADAGIEMISAELAAAIAWATGLQACMHECGLGDHAATLAAAAAGLTAARARLDVLTQDHLPAVEYVIDTGVLIARTTQPACTHLAEALTSIDRARRDVLSIRGLLRDHQQQLAARLPGAALIDRIEAADRHLSSCVWLPLATARALVTQQISMTTVRAPTQPATPTGPEPSAAPEPDADTTGAPYREVRCGQ